MKSKRRFSLSVLASVATHVAVAVALLWPHTAPRVASPRNVHMHLTVVEHHAAPKAAPAPAPAPAPVPKPVPPVPKLVQKPRPTPAQAPAQVPSPEPKPKLATLAPPAPAAVPPKPLLAVSPTPSPEEASSDAGDAGEDQDDGGAEASREALLIRSTLVKPEYTTEALFARVEGLFPMNVKIDEGGRVLDAQLVKKVGYGMDERIVSSVRNARFQPGRDARGRVIAGWVKIKFKLEIPD